MTKKLPASTNISQDKGIAFKINAKTSLIHPPTLYQQQPAGEVHVYSHIMYIDTVFGLGHFRTAPAMVIQDIQAG